MGDLMLAERRKRMAEIDALPPVWRAMVHEFGWTIVAPFVKAGLKPSVARHLIEVVIRGAYEIRDRRATFQLQSPVAARIGEAMGALGVLFTPAALAAELRRRGAVIVPMQPTAAMVLASMDALQNRPGLGLVSKERKHRLRLSDALAAAAAEEYSEAPRDG